MPYILAAVAFMAFGFPPTNAQQKSQPPQSLRLYVLDCGIITPPNVDNYGLKPNEVADTRMVTPCFLIAHPRGSLMWDTGEISDSAFKDGACYRAISITIRKRSRTRKFRSPTRTGSRRQRAVR